MNELTIPEELEKDDPKATHTLRAINGVGLSIEQMVEAARRDVVARKGVIAGMTATVPLVDRVRALLQVEIDEGRVDGDMAKETIIPWFQRIRVEIETSVALNQRELALQEGVVEGLSKAVDRCEMLFKQEQGKAQIRLNEAERGHRDDGGRPLPLREVLDGEESPPKRKRKKEI